MAYEKERYEEPADAPVAIAKWVDRFELVVGEREADEAEALSQRVRAIAAA